jgi:large subunit ribosomal protein L15
MQSNQLQRKTPNKVAKKIGRGGLRGKTSGRGHKGQHQHGGHGIRAEIRDQIKKIPKLRGRGKNSNKSINAENAVVNLKTLQQSFSAGDVVNASTLKEKGIISGARARKTDVKILAHGDISIALRLEGCLVSEAARTKITQAGGSVA